MILWNYIFSDGSSVQLKDFVKWLTGSCEVPPLGFPKMFGISFIHGCPQGCACRPTASTCDLVIKIPVHINSEGKMNEMIQSAIAESDGFGLL